MAKFTRIVKGGDFQLRPLEQLCWRGEWRELVLKTDISSHTLSASKIGSMMSSMLKVSVGSSQIMFR